MRIDTQFSIFLVNRPGVLAKVTNALSKAGVMIFALSLSDSGEHGVLRIVTTDPELTRKVLNEAHDRWTETEILVVPMSNETGTFAVLINKLAAAKINVSYVYCTAPESGGTTNAIVKLTDPASALNLLNK
ncbi:MAG: ACT domain-containing protein [Phycisphaerae bacterium]|nr:ACT domain-containing protein [Phycisphaerae bacterium]